MSAFATLAAGLAGGIAGDSTASAASGAQAGKTVVENNAFSFGNGMESYANAAGSWNQYAEENGLTAEEKIAGLNKQATGDLPEGANIAKAIVEGYQDGVMIAGAWYMGPQVTLGKALTGGIVSTVVNSGFQILDLRKPENENKSWDYKASAASFATGMISPGRGSLETMAISAGGSFFSDGPNFGAQTGSATGAILGWGISTYVPAAGLTGDIFGGVGGQIIGDKVKEIINENN